MTTEPDRIREEIRQTRAALSDDVDALAYKASPSRMVHERTNRVLGAFSGARARIMGTASDLGDRASSAAESIADSAGDAATQVKRSAEGNPLAAGLIVFGGAWLVSSLLPRSEREQHMAHQVKEIAVQHAGPVTDALGESARQIGEHLREPAAHAVESVKATAIDAVDTVKDDASATVDNIQNQSRS